MEDHLIRIQDPLEVKIEGSENLVFPNEGDLGIDIIADRVIEETEDKIIYGTGVKLEQNQFHCFVFPRSSIIKYDLILANSVAVIDSSYRGEIKLAFRKTKPNGFFYVAGEKIAQLVFFFPMVPNIKTVKEIEDNTQRGDGGFGSTGK